MTGSLLGGGDEEVETCPPSLSAPPVSTRLQSTLHCINLSIQQVKSGFRFNPAPLVQQLRLRTCLSVQGTMVGVCGSVGSGKTSLISSILGQVKLPLLV